MQHTLALGGGGQLLNIPSSAPPHARAYREIKLHKHNNVFALTTAVTPGPDLPIITFIVILHHHLHV